jgi:superfamily II DNA/RNA helicase
VAQLHRSLRNHGFNAAPLHGDMSQPERMAALDSFRKGDVKLLIASDVAARGLDIPDVTHVFNFDVPFHADDYVHRIGRTGRAGRSGTAITIVAPADGKSVAAIEKLIGQSIAWMSEPPRAEEAPTRPEPRRNEGKGRRADARPPRPTAAPVTRLADARSRRAPAPNTEEPAHLPAFLLRPVRAKA